MGGVGVVGQVVCNEGDFRLLGTRILFSRLFRSGFGTCIFPTFPKTNRDVGSKVLSTTLAPGLVQPAAFTRVSKGASRETGRFSGVLGRSRVPCRRNGECTCITTLPSNCNDSSYEYVL